MSKVSTVKELIIRELPSVSETDAERLASKVVDAIAPDPDLTQLEYEADYDNPRHVVS